jgi:hypothetical protein
MDLKTESVELESKNWEGEELSKTEATEVEERDILDF